MSVNPIFLVNGNATGIDPTTGQMVGVAVAKNTTITFTLVDPAGIQRVDWEIIGRSANFTVPVITRSGIPFGSTATLTSPNLDGVALGIRSRAIDVYGNASVFQGKLFTPLDGSDLEPFFDGETNWGWKMNENLNAASSSARDIGNFYVTSDGGGSFSPSGQAYGIAIDPGEDNYSGVVLFGPDSAPSGDNDYTIHATPINADGATDAFRVVKIHTKSNSGFSFRLFHCTISTGLVTMTPAAFDFMLTIRGARVPYP